MGTQLNGGELACNYTPDEQQAVRNWISAVAGLEPANVYTMTWNDDGTYDFEVFVLDEHGNKQANPGRTQVLTHHLLAVQLDPPCPVQPR